VPLPRKVGDSATFYPDFLLWLGSDCWAIDTTGPHLLDEKVRGKLLTLETPRLALAVRGTVDLGSGSRKGKDGWSLVLPREHLQPIVEHGDDLDALLGHLISATDTVT
jgi:type III restriction enzyme